MKQKLLFAVCTRTFVARCKSISCDGSGPEVGKETAWKGKVAKFISGVVFGFVEFCTKYWISIKPRSATTSPGISASLKIKKPRFICFVLVPSNFPVNRHSAASSCRAVELWRWPPRVSFKLTSACLSNLNIKADVKSLSLVPTFAPLAV